MPLKKPALSALMGLLALVSLPGLADAHQQGVLARQRSAEMVASYGDWFYFDYHPSIIIGILAMTVVYTLGITVWRKKYKLSETVNRRKAVMFYGSMILLWFTLDGPLHHLSDELLFSAHMVQHLTLQLFWAPLFLLSWPDWLVRPAASVRLVNKVARFVTRPMVAFFLISGMLVFWHLPKLYNLALTYHEVHILQHVIFMTTACIFWWPILGNVDDLVPRPSPDGQLVFMLLSMLPMKGLGAAISLNDSVIYTFYADAPRVWGLTPLGDQRAGGLLMWIPAGLILWAGLAFVFYRWVKHVNPRPGSTGNPKLDAELERAEARRREREALLEAMSGRSPQP